MPLHQLSLDSQIRLCLTPAPGRTFPRLWVRRLAVWEAPGEKPLRSVELKRGSNIIWTPDPIEDVQAQTTGLPQCDGKTTFCRLLCYCLGEDSFGTESDERSIRRKLAHGFAGAEIVINSKVWAVIRQFQSTSSCLGWEGRSLEVAAEEFAKTDKKSMAKLIARVDKSVSEVMTKELLCEFPKLMPAEVARPAPGAPRSRGSRGTPSALSRTTWTGDIQSASLSRWSQTSRPKSVQ